MPFWPRGRPFSGSVMLCLYRIYQEFCIRLECAMGLLNHSLVFFFWGSTFRSYNSVHSFMLLVLTLVKGCLKEV